MGSQLTTGKVSNRGILKDGLMVPNCWIFPNCHEVLSGIEAGHSVAVSAERWFMESDFRRNHEGGKGVVLANTDDVAELASDLSLLDLICIDFPMAVDGRGYSQAHLLRSRYGYSGELRATGEVLVDQLFLMDRCGFNAYAFNEDVDVRQAARFLRPFSVDYQTLFYKEKTLKEKISKYATAHQKDYPKLVGN